MMKFQKYVAVGNDFIIFDGWDTEVSVNLDQVLALCDRRFGIGADGVIILTREQQADFRMIYYNADGSRGEMCGNGARSLIKYAASASRISSSGTFLADDGLHHYQINDNLVSVEILVNDTLHPWDVPNEASCFINTGVPHLIIPVDNIDTVTLNSLGPDMNGHAAHPEGTNVNIIERAKGKLLVRTWERGVNAETLACGTGATASAIFANAVWKLPWPISMTYKGGILNVDFHGNQYWLTGAAELVFEGHILLSGIFPLTHTKTSNSASGRDTNSI
ncbi:diaminopimelate epimerase [bacterium]|nr:diaminopimelate epimerase [bacterium]